MEFVSTINMKDC